MTRIKVGDAAANHRAQSGAAVDLGVLAVFALCAVAIQVGRGSVFQPFLFLDGDAAKLASWAAALDHPEFFRGDSSLGDTSDFRYYFTIIFPLLRSLTRITGSYGTSFVWLLGPHVFLQLVGFYILGRVLLRSRFWAFLLAVVTFPPVPLNLWEVWGTLPDAIPRFGFQALLPFVLAATMQGRERPGFWPGIMVALGLLMYVHPVSTPAWALAVWLGLWVFHPPQWSPRRRVLTMLGLGLVFLVVAAPFTVIYLTNHEHGVSATIPVERVRTIYESLLPPGYFDAPRAARDFAMLWWSPKGLLWVVAACGVGIVRARRPEQRPLVEAVGMWSIGIAIVSFAIPFAEQRFERATGMAPIEIDLVRNLRYLVPIGLLLGVWGFASAHGSLRARGAPRFAISAVGALGVALVVAWWVPHQPRELVDAVACWRQGSIACHPAHWLSAAEAIDAVARETPVGARIFPTRFAHSVQIRFQALRPVVHSRRDPAVLLHGNHEKLLAWHEIHRFQLAGRRHPSAAARLAAHLRLAERLGAHYVLIDATHIPSRLPLRGARVPIHELVWRNDEFALLQMAASRSGLDSLDLPRLEPALRP